jgi:hypothetical protein
MEPWCGGANSRALTLLAVKDELTVEFCAERAQAAGYRYAAVQSIAWCYGGNDISKYTEPGTCWMHCNGDPDQQCGGPCSNSMYMLDVPGTLLRSGGVKVVMVLSCKSSGYCVYCAFCSVLVGVHAYAWTSPSTAYSGPAVAWL